MGDLLIRWIISALAVFIASYLLPEVAVDSVFAAFVTALVLGIINVSVKPVLLLLTLPINVLTLGLFTLVINAALIHLTGIIVPGFSVANFGWALIFAIVLSIITFALHLMTPHDGRE